MIALRPFPCKNKHNNYTGEKGTGANKRPCCRCVDELMSVGTGVGLEGFRAGVSNICVAISEYEKYVSCVPNNRTLPTKRANGRNPNRAPPNKKLKGAAAQQLKFVSKNTYEVTMRKKLGDIYSKWKQLFELGLKFGQPGFYPKGVCRQNEGLFLCEHAVRVILGVHVRPGKTDAWRTKVSPGYNALEQNFIVPRIKDDVHKTLSNDCFRAMVGLLEKNQQPKTVDAVKAIGQNRSFPRELVPSNSEIHTQVMTTKGLRSSVLTLRCIKPKARAARQLLMKGKILLTTPSDTSWSTGYNESHLKTTPKVITEPTKRVSSNLVYSLEGKVSSVHNEQKGENAAYLKHQADIRSYQFCPETHGAAVEQILAAVTEKAGFNADNKAVHRVNNNPTVKYLPTNKSTFALVDLMDRQLAKKKPKGDPLAVSREGKAASIDITRLQKCIDFAFEDYSGRIMKMGAHAKRDRKQDGGGVITPSDYALDYKITMQMPHVDHRGSLQWEWRNQGDIGFIGFMALEPNGMFLRIWPEHKGTEVQHPEYLLYIPPFTLVLVPATLLHAGGFRTSNTGNRRLHFYGYATETEAAEARDAGHMPPLSYRNDYIQKEEGRTRFQLFPKPTRKDEDEWYRTDSLTTFVNNFHFV